MAQTNRITNFPAAGIWSGAAFLIVSFVIMLVSFCGSSAFAQSSVRPPDNAVNLQDLPRSPGAVRQTPGLAKRRATGSGTGNTLGTRSQTDYWRALRNNVKGTVSIPDKNSAVLVQSAGDEWMRFRNQTIFKYAWWGLGGMAALLAVFFLFRGRIRVESGMNGKTIRRFSGFERAGHWLNAIAFIILALTGLNMLFGRYVLLPLIGGEAFATITNLGKLSHNWVAFAFIITLAWIFLQWVKDNILSKDDFGWIIKAGGLLMKGVHPPSKKFNFGEKVVFWTSIIGGVAVILTGLVLLFPFEASILPNVLPGELPIHQMQFAQTWHAIIGLGLTVIIIGHIYIGTVGIEGSFTAMTSGDVDVNWAKEHHSLWLEEVNARDTGKEAPRGSVQPAE